MSAIVIRAEHLSKRFRIGQMTRPHDTLRDTVVDGARRFLRRRPPERSDTLLWALRDVSFEVREGEVLGIVGRNGAGKSTLLKILSQITMPTSGRAELYGRVGSLLEVGTGFHPELTGRENIYLSGAFLGMKRDEITRKLDEIVAFAEVDRFLATPVKRYSTGMYVRLAFAVAAHLEPEILLIDEVLAVGDIAFQRKCLGKMRDVATAGRTVIFVSHNLGAVNTLCRSALLLHDGSLVLAGPTHEVVAHYLDAQNKFFSPVRHPVDDRGEFRLDAVDVVQKGRPTSIVDSRQPFTIRLAYEVFRPVRNSRLVVTLRNHYGEVVLTTCDYDDGPSEETLSRSVGRFVSSVTIPGKLLKPGQLFGTVGVDVRGERVLAAAPDVFRIDVIDLESNAESELHLREGVIAPILPWSTGRAAPERSDSAGRGQSSSDGEAPAHGTTSTASR